ncbi:hypothetical protein [Mycobacterium phage Guo1]|nr:hypothetical protein [Mycobacterium phage Guo1]
MPWDGGVGARWGHPAWVLVGRLARGGATCCRGCAGGCGAGTWFRRSSVGAEAGVRSVGSAWCPDGLGEETVGLDGAAVLAGVVAFDVHVVAAEGYDGDLFTAVLAGLRLGASSRVACGHGSSSVSAGWTQCSFANSKSRGWLVTGLSFRGLPAAGGYERDSDGQLVGQSVGLLAVAVAVRGLLVPELVGATCCHGDNVVDYELPRVEMWELVVDGFAADSAVRVLLRAVVVLATAVRVSALDGASVPVSYCGVAWDAGHQRELSGSGHHSKGW